MTDRRTVLRALGAGAAAWLGGLNVTDLLAAVPPGPDAPFRPLAAPVPTEHEDIAYLHIAEASAFLRTGELTPTDLVEACLDRIARAEPTIAALVETYADEALQEAARATREIAAHGPRSPLHGIPIVHKDLYDIEGRRTKAGSAVRSDVAPARRDATVVQRLRDAGAIVLAKTNTHEFAFGVWTPPTSNPWDLTRVPGGSSGGSAAALAAGMTLGATGTDTGGSIRIPSSLCNTVGLKPTYGRVSRAGIVPLAWTLDHAGPMARSVADCALLLNAIAGPDPRDPTTVAAPVPDYTRGLDAGAAGLVVGVPTSVFFDGAEPAVRARIEDLAHALGTIGVTVVPIDAPDTQYASAAAYLIIQLSEPLAAHEPYLERRPHDYQTQTQVLLTAGAAWHAQHYLRAQRMRAINLHQWMRVFERVDAILTPTTPRGAPPKTEAMLSGVFDLVNYTSAFDMTGFPSLSLPAGFTAEGLPIGAMLTARPFDEARLLRLGHALQETIGFNRIRPPAVTGI